VKTEVKTEEVKTDAKTEEVKTDEKVTVEAKPDTSEAKPEEKTQQKTE
jgi:hypothetical protein